MTVINTAMGLGGAIFFWSVSSTMAQALTLKPEDLAINLGVELLSIDNANSKPNILTNDQKVNELERFTDLSAVGQLSNPWAQLTMDASLMDEHYPKQPELDEHAYLGFTQLTLGPQHHRYYADVSHLVQRVAVDPLEPRKYDERRFSTVGLFGSLRLGAPNLLSVRLNATDIQSANTPALEAKRSGVAAHLGRQISPIYNLGWDAQAYQLEYRDLSGRDLDYWRTGLVFDAALKHTSYLVSIGVNKLEADSTLNSSIGPNNPLLPSAVSKDSSLYSHVVGVYNFGAHNWRVSYDQFVTDTAQGSSELDEFNHEVNINAQLDQVDRFEARKTRLSWENRWPIGVAAKIEAGVNEERYFELSNLDSREQLGAVELSYWMSSHLNIYGQLTNSLYKKVNTLAPLNYRQSNQRFGFKFDKVMKHGTVDVFVGRTDRDFLNNDDDYTSDYYGIKFEYLIYSR